MPGKCLSRYSRKKKRRDEILEQKTPVYAILITSYKSRKIVIFVNGLTHGFGPKMAIFRTFFLKQYWPGKCL